MNSRAIESRILSQLKDVISDASLSHRLRHSVRGPDIVAEIQAGGKKPVLVVIEVCANPRRVPVGHAAEQAKHFAKRLGGIPAVAVPRLGPGLKQFLRDLQVGYLSLDGQIYLRGEGILIDREVSRLGAQLRPAEASSVFADRSSLLLRHLFSRPSGPFGVRDVAAELGISPGLVSRLAAQLRSDGYLVEEGGLARLADRAALLDDWREFYRRRAKRQPEHRKYVHARDVASVMAHLAAAARDKELPKWGLSFHAGASLVAPYAFFSEVHVLLDSASSDDAAAAFSHRLHLEPAERDANVILIEPYYRSSWHHGLREIHGLPVVSDLQLYLDLCSYPRRGAEQADRVRERILALEGEGAAS